MKIAFYTIIEFVFGSFTAAEEKSIKEPLPKSGICEISSAAILGRFAIQWEDSVAKVSRMGETISGRAVGLRPHGTGFRLSIL